MLEFITELAESAGKESLEYFGKITENDIEGKATSKDLVSIADKAIENLIITKITERFPDHDIFGEETGHAGKNSPYCWVIDPIDGTQSFVKFHPYYSISIALYKDGKPFAGAVNAPALNRLFTACSGRGAFLNGRGGMRHRICQIAGKQGGTGSGKIQPHPAPAAGYQTVRFSGTGSGDDCRRSF